MDKLSSINFSRSDALVLSAVLGFVLAAYAMSRSIGWFALEDALLALGFVIVLLLMVNRRRFLNELALLRNKVGHLDRHTDQFFHQTEHLISINASLSHGRFPLPKTGGWVPAPDYLHFLITRLYQRKPAFILEAGSGVSTYLIANILDDIGDGQIVALEHQKTFADETTQLLEAAGVQHRAQVLHAPLRTYTLNGNMYSWYDLTDLELPAPVELFVVDGPPARTGKHARYPALPLLHEQMADDAALLLDDGARTEEREIADMWSRDFDLDVEYLDFEKGAFYIRFASTPTQKKKIQETLT